MLIFTTPSTTPFATTSTASVYYSTLIKTKFTEDY